MPTVSLCMIVRKGDERFLPTCLTNAGNGVDEIIMVVDERTSAFQSIAKEWGARLIEHRFRDSFAEQRNVSIARASSDWILVLDADEILAAADLERLKGLLNGEIVACTLNQLTYTNDVNQARFIPAANEIAKRFGFAGYFSVPAVRLFQNGLGIRFTRRVHEMVDESIEGQGLQSRVRLTSVPLHHLKMLRGDLGESERRYLRLLELETRDNPLNAKALFDQGTIHLFTMNNPAGAVSHLERALEIVPGFEDARLNLAVAYGRLGRYGDALRLYEALEPHPYTLSSKAVCLARLGRYEEAFACLGEAAARWPQSRQRFDQQRAAIEQLRDTTETC